MMTMLLTQTIKYLYNI